MLLQTVGAVVAMPAALHQGGGSTVSEEFR